MTPTPQPAEAVAALRDVFWSDEVEAPNDPAEMYRLLTAAGWTLTRESDLRVLIEEMVGKGVPGAAALLGFSVVRTRDHARCEELREALEEAATYAKHGAAMDHLNRAGIMQDPPHGMGTFAECEAPWCVRAQKRLAGWAALAAPAASPEEE